MIVVDSNSSILKASLSDIVWFYKNSTNAPAATHLYYTFLFCIALVPIQLDKSIFLIFTTNIFIRTSTVGMNDHVVMNNSGFKGRAYSITRSD